MACSLMMLLKILALVVIFTVVSSVADGCGSGCHALVSGPYPVPDSALTASTIHSALYMPSEARLNGPRAWHASAYRPMEWVQVRFNHVSKVYKIQTQGNHDYNQWATRYKILTSKDCNFFNHYTENGREKIFSGNYNRDTVVTHALRTPVKALCVRFVVLSYNHVPVLRFEVIGRRECALGYTLYMNSCYSLLQNPFSWVDAAAYCKIEGGSLVTVDSVAEHKWLTEFILKQSPRYTLLTNKRCKSRNLMHLTNRPLNVCLNNCRVNKSCTTVSSRKGKSGYECWLKYGFHVRDHVCEESEDKGMREHLFLPRVSDVWININRLHDQRQWTTEPGTRAKHFDWAPGNPTNQELLEDCGAMSPVFGYKWISKKCNAEAIFICEN